MLRKFLVIVYYIGAPCIFLITWLFFLIFLSISLWLCCLDLRLAGCAIGWIYDWLELQLAYWDYQEGKKLRLKSGGQVLVH